MWADLGIFPVPLKLQMVRIGHMCLVKRLQGLLYMVKMPLPLSKLQMVPKVVVHLVVVLQSSSILIYGISIYQDIVIATAIATKTLKYLYHVNNIKKYRRGSHYTNARTPFSPEPNCK